MPSITGMVTSARIRSNLCTAAESSAAWPLPASSPSWPAPRRVKATMLRMEAESSTARILAIEAPSVHAGASRQVNQSVETEHGNAALEGVTGAGPAHGEAGRAGIARECGEHLQG